MLLIGDSQAEQLAPRYAHAFDGHAGAGITLMSLPGCIPIPGVSTTRTPYCGQAWQAAYREAGAGGFRRIVVAAAWSVYFDRSASNPSGLTELDDGSSPASMDSLADVEFGRLADAIRRLRAQGAQVVVIGATPRSDANEPHALYARTFWSGAVFEAAQTRSQHEASDAFIRRRLAALRQETGATLVDPLDRPGRRVPTLQGPRALQGHRPLPRLGDDAAALRLPGYLASAARAGRASCRAHADAIAAQIAPLRLPPLDHGGERLLRGANGQGSRCI